MKIITGNYPKRITIVETCIRSPKTFYTKIINQKIKFRIPGMIVKIPFVQSARIGHCLHVPLISKEYDPVNN